MGFVCVTSRVILVFSGVFTFLVDAYPTFAASALAANSFMRSSFGGIFPLFGIQSKFVSIETPSLLIVPFSFLEHQSISEMEDLCSACGNAGQVHRAPSKPFLRPVLIESGASIKYPLRFVNSKH